MRAAAPLVLLALAGCSSPSSVPPPAPCAMVSCDGGPPVEQCVQADDLGEQLSALTGDPLPNDSTGAPCSQLSEPSANHCGPDVLLRITGQPKYGWVAWCPAFGGTCLPKSAPVGAECPPGCLPFDPPRRAICCCEAIR